MSKSERPLVAADHLSVRFRLKDRRSGPATIRAVEDVSLAIAPGETLGLVGESGSGKSTLGRALIGVDEVSAGRVLVDGEPAETRSWRGDLRRHYQMVFQNPLGSLDPRMRVSPIVREPLDIHQIGDPSQRRNRVNELLELVGLDSSFGRLYPHEMSGGQQQRVAIARALAPNPRLIVCDEPVSSLDVSIQAQIVNLLRRLQSELGLAYLFIAHDLALVRNISSRVAVMYMGRIVETGPTEDVISRPMHPYTKALLSAVPIPNVEAERMRQRIVLSGDLPDPTSPPDGCAFHTRCPWSQTPTCVTDRPELRLIDGQVRAACHFAESLADSNDVPQ